MKHVHVKWLKRDSAPLRVNRFRSMIPSHVFNSFPSKNNTSTSRELILLRVTFCLFYHFLVRVSPRNGYSWRLSLVIHVKRQTSSLAVFQWLSQSPCYAINWVLLWFKSWLIKRKHCCQRLYVLAQFGHFSTRSTLNSSKLFVTTWQTKVGTKHKQKNPLPFLKYHFSGNFHPTPDFAVILSAQYLNLEKVVVFHWHN